MKGKSHGQLIALSVLLVLFSGLTTRSLPWQNDVLANENETIASSAEHSLHKLLDGNKRFIEGKLTHPDQTAKRLKEVAKEQHPFAAVISCSDSRLPPEIIFDQGLGDLFVVREAGNFVNDATLGSIEYAVEHLGVHLVMVLGHKRCGAISATAQGDHHAHISNLVDSIHPAIIRAKNQPGDFVENVCHANVELSVKALRQSKPILSLRVKENKLKIVGAYYDVDSGIVKILPL